MYQLSTQLEQQLRAQTRIQIITTAPAPTPPAPLRRAPKLPSHDFLMMSAQPELALQPAYRANLP